MNTFFKTTLLLSIFLTLSSCMKEPKEKIEEVKTPEQYEKVIDSLVGVSTVFPDNIKINDTDTMVQTMVISNAVTQEKFRRQLTVTNIEKSDNQTKFTFQVQAHTNRCSNG